MMVDSFKVEPKSLGGYRYAVYLKELYTGYYYIDFTKGKEEVSSALTRRLKWIKTQSILPVQVVIGDNRTEFKISYKESKEEGLAVFLNPPYTL